MERKRTRLDIVSDMLKVIRGKRDKIKPTHLMYKANLSHTQMKSYLKDMKEKDLIRIEKNGRSKIIILTKKGKDFLNEYSRVREFEDAFGL